MTYIPGTGPQPVFPAAHLSLCPLVCPLSLSHLETTITLHTDHTGQGCDRYTVNIKMKDKLCIYRRGQIK